MKYLFDGTITEFKNFTNKDLGLWKWLIYDDSIKNRYEQVKHYSYIGMLEELANNHKLEHDETELISWLDSQKIMLKIIKTMEKDGNEKIFENMRLIQEFHIPFTRKRADYLICKDNKILIIEFSYANLKRKEYQFQTKLNQVINYKELISNVISKNIDIATYTFILHPEDKDKDSNLEQINNFIEYLFFYLNDKKCDAYKELVKICERVKL